MKIYRLESLNDYKTLPCGFGMNNGVYKDYVAQIFPTGDNTGTDSSPAPLYDVRLKDFWKVLQSRYSDHFWFFGFESLESLGRWFYRKELLERHSDCYRLVCYELPEQSYFIGTCQTIFKAVDVISAEVLDNSVLWK